MYSMKSSKGLVGVPLLLTEAVPFVGLDSIVKAVFSCGPSSPKSSLLSTLKALLVVPSSIVKLSSIAVGELSCFTVSVTVEVLHTASLGAGRHTSTSKTSVPTKPGFGV